jgi:nuclear transport factor 2 (NTF2) superfamily protein
MSKSYPMTATEHTLRDLYAAFNARDIDRVLASLAKDVDWPNAWEGGRLRGRGAVRDYWTRQWAALDPIVEPVGFATDPEGRTVVTVRQVVRDRQGQLLSDGLVEHAYTFEDGLVRRMDVRQP